MRYIALGLLGMGSIDNATAAESKFKGNMFEEWK